MRSECNGKACIFNKNSLSTAFLIWSRVNYREIHKYVSDAFKDATASFINSYSQKGYPWDNACIESFHALIKREWINRFAILDYQHAYRLVFEYIETFYNTVRIHSHCDYCSPDQYEAQYLEKLEESLKLVS
ncbi:hypothetical protein GCWU000341_02829 [Oribacterium sp. oral taxon 078 str. F0262]|uniref:integrase core domain-containing protein n=1 Tax=Oribacterium sp. oral taxon 078 TaxID=652706 RepID=UPI0001CDED26|nr:hypothetical protein GCWU000341_02829 [Oribacterium sp. oral taxon 078 str. F0262]